MKSLLLLALFAVSVQAAQADILANGDFADGTAHWKGDHLTALDTPSQGIVLKLNPKSWTKIAQTFNTRENSLDYEITYSFTAETTFHFDPTPTATVWPVSLNSLTGMYFKTPLTITPGNWLVMMADPASNLLTYCEITQKLGSADSMTITGTIPKLEAHEEKTLILALPPGDGEITVTHIKLSPTAAAEPAAPQPQSP